MSKKIGFIGFGTIGLPMAINLNKAGFEVIGYDALDGSRKRAKATDITVAATLKGVVEQADDAVISMTRGYSQSIEVLLDRDSLLSVDPKGLTIIMMSTLDPDSMSAPGQQVEAAAGVRLIAAAVSGSATEAQTGTLSIMASGPEDRVNAAHPYLDAIGSSTFYYGANPGNSQTAKLVNNMMLGIITNGATEGLRFGEHYNLPWKALLNLFKVSAGDSWVAHNWDSVSKWTEDTALTILLEDLKAAHLKGLEHGITMPFSAPSSTILFDSWGQRPEAK